MDNKTLCQQIKKKNESFAIRGADELGAFKFLTINKKFTQLERNLNNLFHARGRCANAKTDEERNMWNSHCEYFGYLLDEQFKLISDEEVNKFIDWFENKTLTQNKSTKIRLQKIHLISTIQSKVANRSVNVGKLDELCETMQEEIVKL